MTTLIVFGAGDIGGAVAHRAAMLGCVRRVVLVDDDADVARGKALDIRQATPVGGSDVEVVGTDDLSSAVGASIIVVADRYGSEGEWRGDAGLGLIGRIAALNHMAPLVCAGTNQMELVERGAFERDVARTRLFGSAPEALRGAMTALTALEAGTAPRDVSLTILGRPPVSALVPWSDASIAGVRATSVLAPPVLTRLDARLARVWPLGPLALATAAVRVVALALTGAPGHASIFSVRDAAAGVVPRGVALPSTLGRAGLLRAFEPVLTSRDRVRFESA